MEKIKLVHVQLLPLLSGVQVMMLNLLASLDKEKYEISVICKPTTGNSKFGRISTVESQRPDSAPLVKKLLACGYNYIPLKSFRRNLSLFDPIALIQLYFIFKKYKFDIVHTHSSKPGFLGRIAARMAGVKKIIHTVHGFPFHQHQSLVAQKTYRTLEKVAAFFCDKIVVVNNFEREEAIKTKLIPAKKAVTIYNGVTISEPGGKDTDSKPVLSSQLPTINQSDLIIGTVARFTPAKNIVTLTKTAVDVCRHSKDIIFIFVGDGELFTTCRQIVDANNMQRRIIMPGWQDNIKEWLDIMDMFILFSLWEGLSVSILEAMASGLPIIASNIKGNNELVTKDNGWLVDLDNIEGLVKLLLSLPAQRKELARLGQNSLLRAKKRFSHRRFVESYICLYEDKLQTYGKR